MNSVEADNRCLEHRLLKHTGALPNRTNGFYFEYFINATQGINISVFGSETNNIVYIAGTNDKILGKSDSVIIQVKGYPKGRTFNAYQDNVTTELLRTYEIPIVCLAEGPIYCGAIDKIICLTGDEHLAVHPKNDLKQRARPHESNSIFKHSGRPILSFNAVGNDPNGRITEMFIIINNEVCRIPFTSYQHLDAEPELLISYNNKQTVKGFKDTENRYKLRDLYKIEDHGIIPIENTFISFSYKTLLEFCNQRKKEEEDMRHIYNLNMKRLDTSTHVNKLQSEIIKASATTDELIDKKTDLILNIKKAKLILEQINLEHEMKKKPSLPIDRIFSNTSTIVKAIAGILTAGVAAYKILQPILKK